MRKIIVGIMFLLLAANAFALQEVAGPLVMSVNVGGSNSAQYGLLNDGNETITVNLRADGDAAKYLSFPASVSLEPKKLVYTSITASIPADYNSVGTITGNIYAMQEGSPGQVQINVQMMKSVTIMVYGMSQTNQLSQTNQSSQTIQSIQSPNQPDQTNQANQNSNQANQTNQVNQTNQPNQTNQTNQTLNAISQLPLVTPATGLFTLISSYYPAIILAFIVLLVVYIIIRKRSVNDYVIRYEPVKPIESNKPVEPDKPVESSKPDESELKSNETDIK